MAATHGLLLAGARDKLTRAGVCEVLVTDTVAVREQDWPQLHVASIAALLAGVMRHFLANESLSDVS